MQAAGVILSGIPGCGKTKLASVFARSTGLPHRIVHCSDLFFSDHGKSESQLIECFANPTESNKWVLVLEDIDVLAGTQRLDTVEARMLSLLLDCIDTTEAFVVGTTNMLTIVPEEIRRPGRLNTVVDLHLPDAESRAAVLKIMLRNFSKLARADDDILRIAQKAHGFSAADLQSLCMHAFIEHQGDTTADDLVSAVKTISPSALSSFQSKIPHVLFSDIFGMESTISRIRALVLEPIQCSERYREMHVEPPRGALVHGPPGSGKTMLCCAMANELAVNTIWVDASQIRSMVVGESEQAIADLFAQARKSAPCILLFDHIDALAPRRGSSHSSENTGDRIVTSLLVEMDGFSSQTHTLHSALGVFVLAVTSRPHIVDPALLRPGRLDVHIGLGLPTEKQRGEILAGIMARMPAAADVCNSADNICELVERTEGCTGADLENLCREAALSALRKDISSEKVCATPVKTFHSVHLLSIDAIISFGTGEKCDTLMRMPLGMWSKLHRLTWATYFSLMFPVPANYAVPVFMLLFRLLWKNSVAAWGKPFAGEAARAALHRL
ncbi:AAA-domain-containing protein [Coemansia reversa NRRL 1564]|uniref:AAA-domain-containing protein n=1 Tax=Coemansia reversa (strain ATCC 12441 / NRRL 1564) TaxID=763665 RepID=A0A2G5BJZ5_COERN|nr:AAA-domain-containing protein [Coemansia reversa NRRL 1564]|eukprot:PIA19330.1 AAA-domain-containing protein [Coemansia reversa NRRL 1564]